ncbi:hypothetical protein [Actinoplanes sp. N902-109]|uniref:hypothetical protein n=1 Tax=Actinoplanes sp. (strain N902-109) TaxID=649831 RepID=UPI0012FA007D|nr:hypothetical protein [Actinoplanes sp. N902-109]
MADPQTLTTVVAAAGFLVEEFVDLPHLPSPMAVWRPFILASAMPAIRVPYDDADHDGRVDRAWREFSTSNGTLTAAAAVLLSVEGAGRLPWLRVRVKGHLSRASAVALPGQANGFVAMSLDGSASTGVSSEEWETWILADSRPRANP